MAVVAPMQVDTAIPALLRQYWDTKLLEETVQPDIYTKLRTVFDNPDNISMPMDSIVMQGSYQSQKGVRSSTIGFLNALVGVGRGGDSQLQAGFEEQLRAMSQTIFYNEYSHAITQWQYGIHYNEQEPYGLSNKEMTIATKMLGKWHSEMEGLKYREAFLQARDHHLALSPILQPQHWNPQWIVKNGGSAAPVYSANLQTFTNNIAAQIYAAGSGDAATLDASFMNYANYEVVRRRIDPLELKSGSRWVMTVPSTQVYHVMDFSKDDSLVDVWTHYSRLDEERVMFPRLLGQFGKILMVEDERYPTLTLGGSSEPFTLTPGYMWPGNNDQRDHSNTARDVAIIHGRVGVLDWYPTKIHHEYQDNLNYKKWMGKGAFCERGMQIRQYTNPAGTIEARGSIVCVFARSTITA